MASNGENSQMVLVTCTVSITVQYSKLLLNLEQPECLIFEQGQYHILPPGYIHGVLSAMNSAVAEVPVIRNSLRSTALIVMEWESTVLEKRKTGTRLEKATVG